MHAAHVVHTPQGTQSQPKNQQEREDHSPNCNRPGPNDTCAFACTLTHTHNTAAVMGNRVLAQHTLLRVPLSRTLSSAHSVLLGGICWVEHGENTNTGQH